MSTKSSFSVPSVTNNLFHCSYVFWFGDLNFRISSEDLTFQQVALMIEERQLQPLLDQDQLWQARQEERAFHDLHEEQLTFPPTFKFKTGTDVYNAK